MSEILETTTELRRDLLVLAQRFDVVLAFDLDIDMSVWVPDDRVCYIQGGLGPEDEAWTALHELGHAVCDHQENGIQVEAEAWLWAFDNAPASLERGPGAYCFKGYLSHLDLPAGAVVVLIRLYGSARAERGTHPHSDAAGGDEAS